MRIAPRLAAARATLAERDQTATALNAQLKGVCDERDQLRAAVSEKEADAARLAQTVLGLNETIVRISAERDRAYADHELRRKDLEELGRVHAGVSATLKALEDSVAEDRKRVETLKAQMGEVFEEKARAVLKERSEQFEQTAEQKRAELDGLLKPFKDHLEILQSTVSDLEKKRATASVELKTTIDQLMQRADNLSTATTTLSTTLMGPGQARGRWGEIHLDNLLDRSGMSPHCDRDTQEYFRDLEGGARPDVLIRIPHVNLRVPVDAKAPDADYRAYLNATDDGGRRTALAGHARSMENHARELAERNYGRFAGVAPLTIMYVPNEGMLAAALAEDSELWDRCARRNIYLASPLTLLIQLRAYAEGWAVYDQEQNAKRIAEHAGQLYHRLARFAEHLSNIGDKLRQASEAYNRVIGSYQTRLLPHARAMRSLGVIVSNDDRDQVEETVIMVETTPRPLNFEGQPEEEVLDDPPQLDFENGQEQVALEQVSPAPAETEPPF